MINRAFVCSVCRLLRLKVRTQALNNVHRPMTEWPDIGHV
jgi:hypothetical protein